MFNTHTLPPFAKQILGAAVGALTALLLYGVYDLASPYLPTVSLPWMQESSEQEVMHAAAPGEKWQEVIELAKKELRDRQE